MSVNHRDQIAYIQQVEAKAQELSKMTWAQWEEETPVQRHYWMVRARTYIEAPVAGVVKNGQNA